jgi:hypothetical protein
MKHLVVCAVLFTGFFDLVAGNVLNVDRFNTAYKLMCCIDSYYFMMTQPASRKLTENDLVLLHVKSKNKYLHQTSERHFYNQMNK